MAYFKIGNTDFSHCVNSLKVTRAANYNAQTNAAGDTVADYINHKRTIEVGIIPLDAAELAGLLAAVNAFLVELSFLDPVTNAMASNIPCIIPDHGIDYYTIRADRTQAKAFTLKFMEL
jgi:hypothetical protein